MINGKDFEKLVTQHAIGNMVSGVTEFHLTILNRISVLPPERLNEMTQDEFLNWLRMIRDDLCDEMIADSGIEIPASKVLTMGHLSLAKG